MARFKLNKMVFFVCVLFCSIVLLLYCILNILQIKKALSRPIKVDQQLVKDFFLEKKSVCKSLSHCNLMPGDILLRRLITSRTYIFDKVLHPYFTHSALYVGDGKLFEAAGVEKDRRDDIAIKGLSTSDWMDSDIEALVIIRPTRYTKEILNNLLNKFSLYAGDVNYFFGFDKNETSCSEIIYRNLPEIFGNSVTSGQIVVPDYLFMSAIGDNGGFEVLRVGE